MSCSVCYVPEPASPAPDSDTTMEVDISDVNSESSRGQDDSEEPSTPEDKIFRDYPFSDQEKDEEPVKAPQIRCVDTDLHDKGQRIIRSSVRTLVLIKIWFIQKLLKLLCQMILPFKIKQKSIWLLISLIYE